MAEEHHLHEHDKAEAVAVIEFASDALEKAVAQEVGGLNESDQPEYHDKETQRVIRKVDWRLVPMLTSLYLLAFLDRSNIGNAHAAGMLVTLNMTDHQYDVSIPTPQNAFPWLGSLFPSLSCRGEVRAP